MEINVGDAFREENGTLFQIEKITHSDVEARILDPKTKEKTETFIGGSPENFMGMLASTKSEKIDLENHKPTGLIE